VPAIDISETKNELRVKADLPGLSEKDVEVTISGDVLTIKGKKEEEKCEQNENYYRKERSFGSFVRQIPLPTKIKENEVKAKFKNGILHIVMPKSEEEVAKGIKIEVEK
jgi:HSP20 family protein